MFFKFLISSQTISILSCKLFNKTLRLAILATSEQKEKIIKMQAEERRKNEIEKQQIYNKNMFEDRKQKKQIQVIKYEANIFKKIIDKVRNFFSR